MRTHVKDCLKRHSFQKCTKAFCDQKCANNKETDFCRGVCSHHLALFQVNEDLPGPNFLEVASEKTQAEPHEHLTSTLAGDTDFKAVSAMAHTMRTHVKDCLKRHSFQKCTKAFCDQKCANNKETDFCRGVCSHHLALFQVNEDLPGPNFLEVASDSGATPDAISAAAKDDAAATDDAAVSKEEADEQDEEVESEGKALVAEAEAQTDHDETEEDENGLDEMAASADDEEAEDASTGEAAGSFLQRRRSDQ